MKSHASMNRIYRLVWNAALNIWVAVAENAKGRSKGGRAGSSRSAVGFNSASSVITSGSGGFSLSASCRAALLVFSTSGFLAGSLVGFTPVAHADPAGGVVSAGSGSISQSGTATTINQASQRLAIDWNRFSTAANESVVFVQPNAQAIALNRITGTTASSLLGSLTATGQVFILNPNGVLFGAGSQVNVGGLVASTLNMSNTDFMAGNHVFTSSGGTGSVVNQGALTAAQGGYIALLAPDVRNEGVISATLGTALLAAGNKITLNLNNGSLLGFSIDEGAINALADNRQLIQANGGQVLMSAKAANALSAATVNNTGIIEAKTLLNQNGVIKLIGDMQTGQVNVAGKLDASAPNGGDGGFIETSAATVKVADTAVITSRAADGLGGKSGTWLIDPIFGGSFTIAASGGNVSGSVVTAALADGNVKYSNSGDINVNDQVSWSQHNFSLSSGRNVNVNANLNGSGTASLGFEVGQCGGECGSSFSYNIASNVKINLPAGQNFTTKNVNTTKAYTVVTALGAAGDTGSQSLQGIKNNLSGLYVLGADISDPAVSTWNNGAGFTPIGTSASPFTGEFDGLGHTISNLSINRPTTNDVGLFGAKSGNSSIQNLTLKTVNIVGASQTGALVGHDNSYTASGKIINVHSYGNVTGAGDTGGLVGFMEGGSVKLSDANGSVTGSGDNTGGLIGRTNYNTSLLSDHFFGSVSGTNVVGGLVGYNTATIDSSFSNGTTVTGLDKVGGLAGYNRGTITGSNSGFAVTGVSAVGGLVGYNGGSGAGSIQGNSYAGGNVSGTDGVGGLVGYQSASGTTTYSSATGRVNGIGSSTNIGGLVGDNEGQISYSTAAGMVTGVANVGGLAGGNLGSGSISNSSAAGVVSGTNSVGGLVGDNEGQISYSTAAGMVTGVANVGGLAGGNLGSGDVSNSSASGVVLGTNSVGGLVGYQSSGASVHDVNAAGTVTGAVAGVNTGGLIGYNEGSIDTAFATGAVVGGASTGGLVGLNLGSIYNGYANGSVTGQNKTGGLVGENSGHIDSSYAAVPVNGLDSTGGLVGLNGINGSINESYSGGNAIGSTKVGGLVGTNIGSITNTYATGDVSGTSQVGGLVGSHIGSVTSSYASGLVSGTDLSSSNGLIGFGTGAVTGSYWDTQTTGQSASGALSGATGLTTAQMMDSSYLAGLGFTEGGTSTTWTQSQGNTRPFLVSEFNTSIKNAHQLQLMGTNLDYSYTLVNDIDFSELSRSSGMWNTAKGFVPVGSYSKPFVGRLDGQGYTIDKLKINRPAEDNVGLFGFIGDGGSIQNLSLSNVDVRGQDNTGALVGQVSASENNISIDSIQASGSVIGRHSTGGLVGSNQGGDISYSSFFDGAVTGANKTGGLVGYNSGTITNSNTSGSVTGQNYVGGLVGYNAPAPQVFGPSPPPEGGGTTSGPTANITSSNASSNVSGVDSVGGLVGYLDLGSGVANSSAAGSVNGSGQNTGGLVGYNFGLVDQSYATGSVTGGLGSEYTGGLVGNNDPDGKITNSYAAGSVTGTEAVGGLVGHNYGLVSGSYAAGQVMGVTSVGGLAGENGGTISKSYATGTVGVNSAVSIEEGGPESFGGLVGFNSTYSALIDSSFATGAVDSGFNGSNTGGLVGSNAGSISKSYASGSVSGGDSTGGLVGYNTNSISYAYSTGSVTGSESTGGFVGRNANYGSVYNVYAIGHVDGGTGQFTSGLIGQNNSYGYVNAAYWDKSTTGQNGGGSSNAIGLDAGAMFASSNLAGFDVTVDGAWWQSEGNTRPFLRSEYRTNITNAHELQLIAIDPGASYTLANYIDLAEVRQASGMWNPDKGFVPLGNSATPFSGTFDGGNYSINHLFINRPAESDVGLFGVLGSTLASTGTIRNVTLSQADVTGGQGTGALVGRSTSDAYGSSNITNVHSSYGTVHGAGDTGGLVGRADGGSILYAYADGNVAGSGPNTGGLVGSSAADTTISAAGFFGGTVSGTENTGGLVGQNSGGVEGTFAYATVSGTAKTGGLVGENNSSITNSYSGAIVSGLSSVGGLAGSNNGDISNSYTPSGTVTATTRAAGGLVGTNNGTLNGVYATGLVSGADATGGLVGENAGTGAITDTYATGKVTGTGSGTGGLVGVNSGNVNTSYSVGQVTAGTSNTGGLVGQNTNTGGGVTSSYWSVDTSGQAGSAGGTGKTSAQMLALSTFTGFDIDDAGGTGKTWRIYEGNTNPLLRSFLTSFAVDNKSVGYNGTTQQGIDVGYSARNFYVASGRNAGAYGAYSDQQGYDISGGKLVIAKANLALISSNVNKTYNGELGASGTAVATGGTQVFAGDTLSGGTFAFVNKNAGINKTVTISGVTVNDSNGGGNYNVTYLDNQTSSITAANLVLTTNNVTKTYNGGLGAAGTAVATGGTQVFAGDTLSGGSFAFTDKNAGTGNKTVTTSGVTVNDGNSGGNYTVSYANNNSSTIAPKALTVSGLSGTNRAYDGTLIDTLTGTAVLGGLVGTETLTTGGTTSGTLSSANAGNRSVSTNITIADGTGLASNYSISQPLLANVTIAPKALTVSGLSGTNRAYDGTLIDTLTGTAVLGGLVGTETLTTGGTTSGTLSSANAGNRSVSTNITIADGTGLASNYSISQPLLANVTIAPKALTVSGLSGTNRAYDGTLIDTLTGTAVLGGLVGTETLTTGGTTSGTLSSANAGNRSVSTNITIADGTGLASNYSISQPLLANVTIAPKALTVSGLSGTNRAYDGTLIDTLTGTAVLGGLVGTETLTTGGTTSGTLSSANAGNRSVSSTNITIADGTGLASNYSISQPLLANVTIAPKALTVSGLSGTNRAYDGTLIDTLTGTAVLGGLVGTETLTTGGTTSGTLSSANAGNRSVSTNITIADGTGLASNYSISQPLLANVTIAPKALTVSGLSGTNRAYDGTLIDTLTGTAVLGGLVGTETLTTGGTTSGTLSSANAGNRSVSTNITIADGTGLASNYSISQPLLANVTIAPKALTVSGLSGTNRAYDGTLIDTLTGTAVLGGLVGTETLTTGGTTSGTLSSANAGNRSVSTNITIADGTGLASNYSISQPLLANVTIAPKALTVSGLSGTNRAYDGTLIDTLTGTAVLGGLVGTETLTTGGTTSGTLSSANAGNRSVSTNITIADGTGLASNYSISQPLLANVTIAPKALTVSGLSGTNRAYDGTLIDTLTGTAVLGGLVGTETLTTGGTTSGTLSSANAGNRSVSTNITIADGTGLASNYSISQPLLANVTIAPKALTVSGLSGTNRAYDGTLIDTLTGTAVLGGLVGTETLTTGGTTSGTLSSANAGNRSVSSTNITIADGTGLASNYSISQPLLANVTIAPKALTVSGLSGTNRAYDGTLIDTLTGTAVLGGLVGTETLTTGGTTSGTLSSANAGNRSVSTNITIADGTGLASNYSISQPLLANVTIAPKALTVSGLSGTNRAYDGTLIDTLTGTAVLGGLVGTETLTTGGTTSGTLSSANAGNRSVSTNITIADGTGLASNYSISQPLLANVTIAPKALTVSGLSGTNRAYDGTLIDTLTGTAVLGGLVGTETLTTGGTTSGTLSSANAGNRSVSTNITIADGTGLASNYSISQPLLANVTIAPKALTVSGTVVADKVYNGDISATVTGGSLSGVIPADTAAVTLAQSGTFVSKNAANDIGVTIADSITGTAANNYSVIQPTGLTASISKAALTIAATGLAKVYDGTNAATVNYSDSHFGNDNIIVSGNASYLDKNVGTAKTVNVTGISVTGGDANNYTLGSTSASTTADITKRSLTITGTGTDKVYDGTTASGIVALSDNRISGDVLNVASAGASFVDKNAGTLKDVNVTGISVGGTDAGNYSFQSTGVAKANITPRTLSVVASGVDKVYDGTTAASANYRDNRLAGDSFTIGGTANFLDKNVATGNIFGGTVVTTVDANGNSTSVVVIGNTVGIIEKAVNVNNIALSGLDAGNYLANTTAATTAKITPKALTIAASGVNKVYDGTTSATALLTDNRAAGDALTTAYSAASFANKNAGTAKTVNVNGISVTGTDLSNYTYSGGATAVTTANITPRALAVTATGINKTYDGTTADAVVLGDNRVAGDLLTLSNAAANFSDKNAGTGKTVSVSGINVTGSDFANYTFNTAALTTASITPKALGYTTSAASKIYDGNTSAIATLSNLTGLIGTETVNVAGNTASFNSKNVASANRVTVNGVTLSDGSGLASNYSIAAGGTAAATITARGLSVTAAGFNKTYDGNTSATVSYSDNRIGGDILAISGNANFVDKNAALGKTVNVNGINLTGQDASNYSLGSTVASTTADIGRRALTVAAGGIDKAYDGTITASVLYSDNRVANDVLSITGTASYLDANAAIGKTVNVSGIALDSTDAANYTVNSTAATTASITPKTLTYNTSASGKVYDGNANALATVSGLNGLVGNETVNVASTSATFNSKDVSTANTVTVNSIALANGGNGGVATNYQIAAGGTAAASISARPLSYTTGTTSKVYDGTATGVTTISGLTGLVGNETVSATASATFNSKNVADANQITVNSISLANGSGGGLASNYSVAAGGTAAAAITAKALAYSTTAADKTYDGSTNASASLSLTGLIGLETVNVANSNATFNSKDVLLANLVTVNGATLADGTNGGKASNYSIAGGGTAAARINAKLLTYDTAAASKVYDGSTSAIAGLSIIGSGLVNNETVTATGSATYNSKDVATANLVTVNSAVLANGANGGLASNYRINAGGTAASGITRRGLTIAATGVNKVYDGTLTASALLSDNRVTGDSLTTAYGAASYDDKNVANGKTVNVSGIAVSGGDANNYSPTNSTAVTSANITPRALTVSATGVNKVYDGTSSASATLSDNRVANDVLTTAYASASYSDKNAGNGKVINVSGISLGSTDARNYTFNTSAVTAASITPKVLNIVATGTNKIYDGTTAAVVTYADNRVAGDVLSIAGTASFADRNVASGKTVSVSNVALSNTDAGNYSYSTTLLTSASITPKPLSVVANNDSKFYSGVAYSGGNGVTYSGLVAGDTSAAVAGSPSYSGSSQGATATGNYVIAPGGLSSNNYTLAYVSGVLSISPANSELAALGGSGLIPAYDSVLQGVSDSPPQGQGSSGIPNILNPNTSNQGSSGSLANTVGCGVQMPPGINTAACQ